MPTYAYIQLRSYKANSLPKTFLKRIYAYLHRFIQLIEVILPLTFP